jgi:hypothetical protein
MTLINKQFLLKLNPNNDSIRRYIDELEDYSYTPLEFLDSKDFNDNFKVEVITSQNDILTDDELKKFALDCASRVIEECEEDTIREFFTISLLADNYINTDESETFLKKRVYWDICRDSWKLAMERSCNTLQKKYFNVVMSCFDSIPRQAAYLTSLDAAVAKSRFDINSLNVDGNKFLSERSVQVEMLKNMVKNKYE